MDTAPFKITILGSGTCVPRLDRKPCAVLLQHNQFNILFDIGPGIIGQLVKAGITINDIDMICLSHFHLDHCADLAPFIFATKYPGFLRKKNLVVMGGPGLKQMYSGLNTVYDHHLDMPEDLFDLVEIPDTGRMSMDDYGLSVEWMKTVHKPESRAYRITDASGKQMVYTGDTDVCPELSEFAKAVDLMICESSMPDDQKVPGHLTPKLAGGLAENAGIKTLVLTHLYPECDTVDIRSQCRKAFQGNIFLAKDLMTFFL